MDYGVVSLLVPLATIIVAIWSKDVVIALLGGSFVGLMALNGYSPTASFVALFDGIVTLFSEGWITKTIIFIMAVGAIMKLLEASGAVDEFVEFLSRKAKKIDSPIGAMILAYIIGLVIFIESSITVMVASIVAKPLCDKNGVSREKLAYICDSTSAPICSMLPLNGWGALLLGLITASVTTGVIGGEPIKILLEALLYNFYAIFTIIIVLIVIYKDINIGAMKHTVAREYQPTISTSRKSNPWKLILPLVILVGSVPIGLYLTGKGDIFKGSGSTSVYYASIITLLFLYIFFVLATKSLKHKEYFKVTYAGLADMIPITIVMLLAFLIGKIIGDLGTAKYLAAIMGDSISASLVPLIIFLLSSLMAFATGTSWGTFSIMLPIAIALGSAMGIPPALMVAAVISGGVFGDHTSPISDTTIISSMAAGCDNMAHVNTQLPYALFAGALAGLAFLIAGLMVV